MHAEVPLLYILTTDVALNIHVRRRDVALLLMPLLLWLHVVRCYLRFPSARQYDSHLAIRCIYCIIITSVHNNFEKPAKPNAFFVLNLLRNSENQMEFKKIKWIPWFIGLFYEF